MSGLCIFHVESDGGVHFTLSIEIKELELIFRNSGNRDIVHSAPQIGENIKKFTKFCGILYLFRITHNPKNIDTNFVDYVPPP